MVIYFDLDDTLYRLYDPFYKAYQKVFHEDLDIYALWKQSRIYSNEIYPKYLNKLITKDELSPIIDFPIIISEKVGYQKPQKEIFELIQGNDSYYVGDGYEIDMMGAYQAGVKTIWYNHQKQEKDTSFIDFVVYSDEELLEVVKKLNND